MKSFFNTTIQKYNIYAILTLEVPELAVISQTLLAFAGIYFWEALRMTCECVIALVTCVATIITTVIAVLSYLKDKKE